MSLELDIHFSEHPVFTRKFRKFCRKHQNASIDFDHLKRLLSIHFHSMRKQTVFTSKVLRRIDRVGPNIEAYKIILSIKGLRQGNCPRVCFWREGCLIIFLCFGTHIENYKDSELKILVQRCIKDINPSIQFKEV